MLKVSLLALMLMACATPAQCSDFLYAENEGNGRIVLSNARCYDDRKMMIVRAIAPNGEVAFSGCWRKEGNVVLVEWDDGTRYQYDLIDFMPTPYACRVLLKENKVDAEILGCELEEH